MTDDPVVFELAAVTRTQTHTQNNSKTESNTPSLDLWHVGELAVVLKRVAHVVVLLCQEFVAAEYAYRHTCTLTYICDLLLAAAAAAALLFCMKSVI